MALCGRFGIWSFIGGRVGLGLILYIYLYIYMSFFCASVKFSCEALRALSPSVPDGQLHLCPALKGIRPLKTTHMHAHTVMHTGLPLARSLSLPRSLSHTYK